MSDASNTMITVIAAATVPVAVTLDQAKTIQIRSGTKRKLDELGKKGETYDAIICKLIDLYQKHLGLQNFRSRSRTSA